MTGGGFGGVIGRLRREARLRQAAGLTDGQLLSNFARDGDEAAFEALLCRHGPMVLGLCARLLGNQADAEDAFQATFLVLARRAGSVRSAVGVGSWLYAVARNTALRARAVRRRRAEKERQAAVPAQASAPAAAGGELRELLDLEVGRLPDRYRAAVVLCGLEGRTLQEAARLLGWTRGTVASRLARGRALLARRLGRRGPLLASAAVAAVLAPAEAPACVPAPLLAGTIKAATVAAAARGVPAGLVSAQAAALTRGVLRAMLMHKLKGFLAASSLAAVVVAGSGLLSREAPAVAQDSVPSSVTPAPRGRVGEPAPARRGEAGSDATRPAAAPRAADVEERLRRLEKRMEEALRALEALSRPTTDRTAPTDGGSILRPREATPAPAAELPALPRQPAVTEQPPPAEQLRDLEQRVRRLEENMERVLRTLEKLAPQNRPVPRGR